MREERTKGHWRAAGIIYLVRGDYVIGEVSGNRSNEAKADAHTISW